MNNMKKLIVFLSCLLLATDVSAQVVSQGFGGDSPWLVATAPQTNSGLLDGNGDTVVLELKGAVGASAGFPDTNDFNGTVIFEASNDGVEWNQVQANSRLTWEPSHSQISAVQPSNHEWVFALVGGETHVRVKVTAYTSGSVTPVLTGTASPSGPAQNAMFPGAGGGRPLGTMLVGGRSGSEARPVTVRGDNDGADDQAFVVRDMAGTRRVGAALTGANDFGKAIGGIDSSDVYQFGEIRDTDPASNVNGLVVRNIPSGTQTVGAVNLDIRDLVFATDTVDVSGSSVTVDNAAGAAAVNVQDGGNSITVTVRSPT